MGQRIQWLIQLRWLASSAVIYGTFVATGMLGVNLDPLPLYLIGAAIAAYNSLFLIGLKWSEVAFAGRQSEVARFLANAQIVVDLLFLTLLIHFSGGVENPFSFYFVFHVVIASILLSRRDTFLQATVANVLFAGMVLGEYAGIVPHRNVFPSMRPGPAMDGLFVAATLVVFASTLYLVAYMATSIVGRLRERDRAILGLNSELETKARELEEAYNRLADLERMKSQYMRKVSHEIRAPMAAIQSSLRVVLDGLTGDVPPKQKEMVARAEKRVQGLLGLVNDLLILSKTREAKLFTQRTWVDSRQVVEKVVALQAERAEARAISLVVHQEEAVPSLFADPEALEQMLTNLLSNAINYTSSGGRVEFTVDSVGDSVRFRVADTGIGIPPADQPKIFNEFYRAENARRFSEVGTGLGLSIVRSIVDMHGGTIDVQSTVGVGTTFTVLFPRGNGPDQQEEVIDEQSAETAPTHRTERQTADSEEVHQGGSYMMTGEPAHKETQAKALVSQKAALPDLLALLQRHGPVYGPTRKNNGAVFSPISSAADLVLDYGTTVLSPKKYLLQPMETLFSVRKMKGFEVQERVPSDSQVVFGVHSCDLAAIGLLDKVYRQSYVDPYYSARRDATLLVAMTCTSPPYDKCFCASMGTGPSPRSGYDLLLTDLGDGLLLEVGSSRGAAAIEGLGWEDATDGALAKKDSLVRAAASKMPKAMDTSDLPRAMNANFDHPYWAKLKEQCLGCGNCALSCPSCYCYNVVDRVALDTVSVNRTRTWDACLLLEFAEVHGGNFRKERDARLKQFMYHKLAYWVDQYGTFGCVGCGRCINACPAGIDITAAVAEIRGEVQ